MKRVFINDIRDIANASREELFEPSRSVGSNRPLCIMHWTAGWGDSLFPDYHVSVTTDGRKPLVRFGAIDAKHRPENIVFEDLTVDGKPVGDGKAADRGRITEPWNWRTERSCKF